MSVPAEFTTPYTGGVNLDYEMDFDFLVDGKRAVLRTSGSRTIINPYADRETDKQKAVGVLMQSTLERVAAGRKVEMKLGETEITLDESVLKSIREFVKALSR